MLYFEIFWLEPFRSRVTHHSGLGKLPRRTQRTTCKGLLAEASQETSLLWRLSLAGEIARGGMGDRFLALQVSLNRRRGQDDFERPIRFAVGDPKISDRSHVGIADFIIRTSSRSTKWGSMKEITSTPWPMLKVRAWHRS